MEQEDGKVQKGKGRLGSLTNPETYDEVPGHVIPIIEGEFDDFGSEAGQFLEGQTPEDQFIGFRLKQGVYGQRQPGVQMIRVKLPFGGVTPEQMDAFADVVEAYAPLNKGHITTRQNIQIHHVPLDQMVHMLRDLAPSGLSSREGCGNTVRNVTGDPWAGIAKDEIFDPTPYAGAYTRYFVRHPTTQLMPRKIKTAFTGSDADRAITGIHDIAFISRIRDGVRGFEVRVGGGTSIMARVAPTVYDFVEADNGDFLEVSEAILRVYDRQAWLRPNRARARIKVLVDKVGVEEFRRMVDAELEGEWTAERDFTIDRLRFDIDEQAMLPEPGTRTTSPNGDRAEFDRFLEANTSEQRQEGFRAVEVKVIRGDLTPEQFRGLGQIMREYTGGFARMTVQQNIVLRWVREEALHDVWLRLKELDLEDVGPRRVTDVVSCPGTDSCKMGITSSMGLNQAVQEKVESMDITDPLTREIQIKMSGCPNGCSQHHVANIGFYGASIKVGGRTMPAYVTHLGGKYTDGDTIYGTRLKVRLPARRVPEAVERWINLYEGEREEGEVFNAFVERVGTTRMEEAVKELTLPVEFDLDTMQQFIDWNRSDPYVVERGEGECAV
ncbi:MAG: nitrite/sulfite reductase [Thermoleophilia bacterium]|nr:nitrite/sulfite reductase [Thermoleophilia bacterium]